MGNTADKTTLLTVKLPAALGRDLELEAERRGLSKSELVRQALARFVAEPAPRAYGPSALDLAGDLVGSVRAAPADLSTDPRHLEDFGRD